jgi:hypothetical protein
MKSLLVLLLSPFLAVDEFEGCKRSEATQRKEKQKKRRLFLRKEEILDKEGVAVSSYRSDPIGFRFRVSLKLQSW